MLHLRFGKKIKFSDYCFEQKKFNYAQKNVIKNFDFGPRIFFYFLHFLILILIKNVYFTKHQQCEQFSIKSTHKFTSKIIFLICSSNLGSIAHSSNNIKFILYVQNSAYIMGCMTILR